MHDFFGNFHFGEFDDLYGKKKKKRDRTQPDDYWDYFDGENETRTRGKRKQSNMRSNDLFENLSKIRIVAQKKMEKHNKTMVENVNFFQYKF